VNFTDPGGLGKCPAGSEDTCIEVIAPAPAWQTFWWWYSYYMRSPYDSDYWNSQMQDYYRRGGGGQDVDLLRIDPVGPNVQSGDITIYNVIREGTRFAIVKDRFNILSERLNDDLDCLMWLSEGERGGWAVNEGLRASVGTRIGVADRIEEAGNKAPGIAAMANVAPEWEIIVNGNGLFFSSTGNVPGIPVQLPGNSVNGRVLILLHELAHVARRIADNDVAANVNAANTAQVFANCRKTVLGP
jgi:hypothetical protein